MTQSTTQYYQYDMMCMGWNTMNIVGLIRFDFASKRNGRSLSSTYITSENISFTLLHYQYTSLSEFQAWKSWCDTNGVDIVDERLDGFYCSTELICCVNIALMCLQDRNEDRPTISEIIHIYIASINLLPTLKEPTYTYLSLGGIQHLSSTNHIFSINNNTQRTFEGRKIDVYLFKERNNIMSIFLFPKNSVVKKTIASSSEDFII